jgi:hypothetical protein
MILKAPENSTEAWRLAVTVAKQHQGRTAMPKSSAPRRCALAVVLALTTALTGAAQAQTYAAVSTSDAVGHAAWAETVTITLTADSFRYQPDGLPDHPLADAYLVPIGHEQPFTDFKVKQTVGFVTAAPIDVTIPPVPVYSDQTNDTGLGMIGVMISGAPLFNDYENP